MTSITYIGMDVHTTNYTLCCYTIEERLNKQNCCLKFLHPHRVILSVMQSAANLLINDCRWQSHLS